MLETQGRQWLDRAVKRWNDSWESRIDAAQFPQCANADESAIRLTKWKGEMDKILDGKVVTYLSRGCIDPLQSLYGDEIHTVAWILHADIVLEMEKICGQAIPNSRPNYTFPYVYWARNLWCADPESDLNRPLHD